MRYLLIRYINITYIYYLYIYITYTIKCVGPGPRCMGPTEAMGAMGRTNVHGAEPMRSMGPMEPHERWIYWIPKDMFGVHRQAP